jgi:two-component system phosphate regulon sensor histidine kinase PhoR
METLRKEFVANVSHELRTPLSLIQGSAETLIGLHENAGENSALASDTLQFLHTIQRHGIRLNTLITDLLHLSRLEAPAPACHPEPTALALFIRDYLAEHMSEQVFPGHDILNRIPADVGVCNMDRPQITQVLENLLTNARIHTPPGTRIELHARTLRGTAPLGVEVEIRDNGPGIPPEDLPHVFERFYRVDKGRSRQNGGTGLGLSIVKHIIQLHGGVVRAESTLGKGSSFYFTLPLLRP